MGTDNTQFHRRFMVWRRKASERSSTFSLRFKAIGGSVERVVSGMSLGRKNSMYGSFKGTLGM